MAEHLDLGSGDDTLTHSVRVALVTSGRCGAQGQPARFCETVIRPVVRYVIRLSSDTDATGVGANLFVGGGM